MYILAGLFFTFIIVALPIFMQRTAHQSIDEKNINYIKLNIYVSCLKECKVNRLPIME